MAAIGLALADARPALAAAAPAAVPVDRFPGLASAYAVRIDGEIVWAAAPDVPRPPASLAKLLTALALLRDPSYRPDDVVTVSADAARIEGSRIGLRSGERVRAADLLTGMLVRSGNDACVALVQHVGGSLASFRAALDRAARELGLTATRIVHPCGLDAPGQATTVRDLLRLADAALAEPGIRLRAGAERAEIRTEAGRRIRFGNTNALIGRVAGANGLKSGYTSRAGRCLIATADRGGHRVVIVMLDAKERWWEASSLIPQAIGYARLRGPAR